MKTSSWIIIGIIAILLIAAGIYYFSKTTAPASDNLNNIPPGPPTPSTPESASVEISGFAFNPASLTINKGDTVVWTNKDSAPHPIVSDSGNEISSNSLSNGQTYSHTFSAAGTYNYHCSIHTSMKGTVIVQ